jgi:hypothetical protein
MNKKHYHKSCGGLLTLKQGDLRCSRHGVIKRGIKHKEGDSLDDSTLLGFLGGFLAGEILSSSVFSSAGDDDSSYSGGGGDSGGGGSSDSWSDSSSGGGSDSGSGAGGTGGD